MLLLRLAGRSVCLSVSIIIIIIIVFKLNIIDQLS